MTLAITDCYYFTFAPLTMPTFYTDLHTLQPTKRHRASPGMPFHSNKLSLPTKVDTWTIASSILWPFADALRVTDRLSDPLSLCSPRFVGGSFAPGLSSAATYARPLRRFDAQGRQLTEIGRVDGEAQINVLIASSRLRLQRNIPLRLAGPSKTCSISGNASAS